MKEKLHFIQKKKKNNFILNIKKKTLKKIKIKNRKKSIEFISKIYCGGNVRIVVVIYHLNIN